LKKITNIFDGTNNAMAAFGSILIIFVMLLICAQIVMRRFLGQSIFWAIDISEFSLIYIPFLGAAWLLRKDGHVIIEVVITRFRPRGQAMIHFINSIIGGAACVVITWYGTAVTWDFHQLSYTMDTLLAPPMWPLTIIIPIGGFLLTIQFARRAYRYWKNWRG
jgi:TRAP-type C4-dicarboxylate transport system permease small subunit